MQPTKTAGFPVSLLQMLVTSLITILLQTPPVERKVRDGGKTAMGPERQLTGSKLGHAIMARNEI